MKNIKLDQFEEVVNNLKFLILEHGHFYGDNNWKHYNIISPYCRLYYILDGEGYVENTQQRVDLKPGYTYLIPSNSTFNYICDSKIEKFYIHFRTELFLVTDIFASIQNILFHPFESKGLVHLIKNPDSSSIGNSLSLKAIITNSLSTFIKDTSYNNITNLDVVLKYKEILDYIKKNSSSQLTIKNICTVLNASDISLSRSFKKDMGFSIKQYIDRMVLQKALDMLLLTNMNIKEIALSLEFCDEFYFSRFFKKNTGQSPRAYRKQNTLSY